MSISRMQAYEISDGFNVNRFVCYFDMLRINCVKKNAITEIRFATCAGLHIY